MHPDYSNIPKFPTAYYAVDLPLDSLKHNIIDRYVNEYGLQMNPDFQRGHVWSQDQKSRFMEYFLRGGESGKNIYTNCPGWNRGSRKDFVLVDGLQRLSAALEFLDDKVTAFGYFKSEFEGRLPFYTFRLHVAILETRAEVLQWYLDFNSAGTVHTQEELDRVRGLLLAEGK